MVMCTAAELDPGLPTAAEIEGLSRFVRKVRNDIERAPEPPSPLRALTRVGGQVGVHPHGNETSQAASTCRAHASSHKVCAVFPPNIYIYTLLRLHLC